MCWKLVSFLMACDTGGERKVALRVTASRQKRAKNEGGEFVFAIENTLDDVSLSQGGYSASFSRMVRERRDQADCGGGSEAENDLHKQPFLNSDRSCEPLFKRPDLYEIGSGKQRSWCSTSE